MPTTSHTVTTIHPEHIGVFSMTGCFVNPCFSNRYIYGCIRHNIYFFNWQEKQGLEDFSLFEGILIRFQVLGRDHVLN